MFVKFRVRLWILVLILISGGVSLIARLWHLQIDEYEKYLHELPTTGTKLIRIPGNRGQIKDANGQLLVTNEMSREIHFNLHEIVEHFYPKPSDRPTRFIEQKLPGHRIQQIKVDDVVTMVSDTILAQLDAMGLAVPYNAQDMQVHYRSTFGGRVPWVYRRDISPTDFFKIAEQSFALPGVIVNVTPKRKYIYDAFASHILGYTRLPDIDNVSASERQEWSVYLGDDFGVTGIELTMDSHLRGKPGTQTLAVDEKGRITGTSSYVPPKPGNDVWLTIDSKIQFICEQALVEGKVGRGAVVVLNPNNGHVLGMASVPNYNPNRFIPYISHSEFQEYRENKANPLLNRAIRPYAPGSTYKIVTALGACLAKVDRSYFACGGGMAFGSKFMKCHIASKGGNHGTIDLPTALKTSCNGFFYRQGNKAGIDHLTQAGRLLGLGEATGIQLDGETKGILPGKEWLESVRPGMTWTNALTANTSIGQGDVLCSPLQMASVMAAMANGGKVYRPTLIKQIVDAEGNPIPRAIEAPRDLLQEGVTSKQIESIRRGLWKVVNEQGGTARVAKLDKVEVAGKTGTAQFKLHGKQDNHTWFISFAPYDQPRYAIAVLVQGGKSGGGVAAPVATRVLSEIMALEQGFTLNLKPLKEIAGNFDPIDSITYPGQSGYLIDTIDTDEDTGDEAEARESQTEAAPSNAGPSLRREADAEGSRKPVKKSGKKR